MAVPDPLNPQVDIMDGLQLLPGATEFLTWLQLGCLGSPEDGF